MWETTDLSTRETVLYLVLVALILCCVGIHGYYESKKHERYQHCLVKWDGGACYGFYNTTGRNMVICDDAVTYYAVSNVRVDCSNLSRMESK